MKQNLAKPQEEMVISSTIIDEFNTPLLVIDGESGQKNQ